MLGTVELLAEPLDPLLESNPNRLGAIMICLGNQLLHRRLEVVWVGSMSEFAAAGDGCRNQILLRAHPPGLVVIESLPDGQQHPLELLQLAVIGVHRVRARVRARVRTAVRTHLLDAAVARVIAVCTVAAAHELPVPPWAPAETLGLFLFLCDSAVQRRRLAGFVEVKFERRDGRNLGDVTAQILGVERCALRHVSCPQRLYLFLNGLDLWVHVRGIQNLTDLLELLGIRGYLSKQRPGRRQGAPKVLFIGAGVQCSVRGLEGEFDGCLLYTSDAADEEDSVDLGGRRIIKKKKKNKNSMLESNGKTKNVARGRWENIGRVSEAVLGNVR
eukprot:TRINITY_DN3404_c0_g3_i1.p1 TRINITY_DN3404_c0_g3~~TRINITY_DN3404_c0_g3_i1.p1  ORF type:complete len:330 (-),score=45.10 TRINITY_DN3404_c0_g3_i1:4-993(-)